MRRWVIAAAFVVLSVVVATGITAQETCSSFINQALTQLSTNCGDLSRNSACYGYDNVIATFFEPLSPDAFSHPNDRVDLAALESITTSPLNIQTSQWGIAVMKAQANLPDALPGQAVTFLLLGDVHLQTGVEQGSDMKPMQAVYFTTGIGDTKCSDAPQSSLIIQGPKDITIDLRVNGADIQLGSTAVFRSTEDNAMECGVIDGAAHVGKDGQVILAGLAARVPLDAQLNTDGNWGDNEPIEDDDANALQVLRAVPDGVLNYTPDVPMPDEIALIAALNADAVESLRSDELRAVVRLMIAAGITPEFAAGWDADQLDAFIDEHSDELDQLLADAGQPGLDESGSETDATSGDGGT